MSSCLLTILDNRLIGFLFFIFSERAFFLGDGQLRINNLELGNLISHQEPLDTFLHGFIFRILHPLTGAGGRTVYRLVSIVAGVGAIGGTTVFFRRTFDKTGERWFLILLVLSSGTVQLFFGYVESYTMVNAFTLVFLAATIQMLERKKYSILPALLFSLAVVSHSVSLVLMPGLLYAYHVIIRRESVGRFRLWMKPAGIFVTFILLAVGGLWLLGEPPSRFVDKFLHGEQYAASFLCGNIIYNVFRISLFGCCQ